MMRDERILAQGITVSNNTRKTGLNNNDMIIGASGSGKTGGYVIPNIQALTGSLVVTDTKGNLCKRFTKQLQERGYEVATLDFVNPLQSCGYNPMEGIRRYKDGSCREQDVLTLANTLVPLLDGSEPFWERAAASYIAFLIGFVAEALPKQEQNLSVVCELHQEYLGSEYKIPRMLKWLNEHPNSFAAKKYKELKAIIPVERTWGCILEFANVALNCFNYKEAEHIFKQKKSFDIKSLGQKKTVLFLNVSDTDRAFDQAVNAFYTQALQILCAEADENPDGRLKVPVHIIMDDFATNAKIPDFDKVISVIRSREVSVSLVLQSLTQLNSMYGESATSTILTNCDHILYLGCQDLNTAEYIAQRVNKTKNTVLCKPREKMYLLTNGEEGRLVDKVLPYSTVAPVVREFEEEKKASQSLAC